MKTALNFLAILMAAVANILTGHLIAHIGKVQTAHWMKQDCELPRLTTLCLSYATSPVAVAFGWFFGVMTMVGLSALLRSENGRSSFLWLLSLSFVVVIVQLMAFAFGMALPSEVVRSMMR